MINLNLEVTSDLRSISKLYLFINLFLWHLKGTFAALTSPPSLPPPPHSLTHPLSQTQQNNLLIKSTDLVLDKLGKDEKIFSFRDSFV